MSRPAGILALDRSLRRYDVDGRLHVSDCCISKANVCPYYGREIPNGDALGLDPNRLYHLYRDPAELEAAAPTFANMPLMIRHVGVNADNTPKELICGTIGSAVRFDAPYLVADLAVWTADGIEAVETGEQRELSCGYRYRADMTPGVSPDGVAYDGVMRDIKANHVALVRVGRAGPDVLVHDELPPGAFQMKSRFLTALLSILKVTPTADQAVALDAAYDTEVKAEDAHELSADEMKAACDSAMKELGKDSLTDEEKEDAYKRAAKDKKAKDEAAAESERKTAQDAAIKLAVDEALKTRVTADEVTTRVNTAVAAALATERALVAARVAVEPLVGEVTCDSAEAVYRFALDKVGTDHKGVHADALPALVKTALDKKNSTATSAALAQDAAASDASASAFPGLSRFNRR